jgi:hypothetical protein
VPLITCDFTTKTNKNLKMRKNKNKIRRFVPQGVPRGVLGLNPFKQPNVTSTLILRKRFRFQASSALTAGITVPMIKDLMGIAAGANSVIMFIDSFRIRKVEMRNSSALGGTPTTVTLEWNGTTGSSSARFSSSSFGLDPAFISRVPPPGSIASFWHSGAETSTLFSMEGGAQTIVDLVLDITLTDDTTVGLTATTTALTAYDVVVKYLDGICAGAAGVLVPVGWQHSFPN